MNRLKINDDQKMAIYNSTEEMISIIKIAIIEIDNAKKVLCGLCSEEKLDTYYTWTIDERLNEAKIRLNMYLVRIEEFRKEADHYNLSTSGFY